MSDQEMTRLKYPVGKFLKPDVINGVQIAEWISVIEQFPDEVTQLVQNLTTEELNWRYRPEGWTIKQVVHHCCDSHMNSVFRFKLTLTENVPDIRPYYEDRWAELYDSHDNDISDALGLLRSLHGKWTKLLRSLDADQLKKQYRHPEHGRLFTLEETIGIYAWHCNHHKAHIKQALQAQGQFPA